MGIKFPRDLSGTGVLCAFGVLVTLGDLWLIWWTETNAVCVQQAQDDAKLSVWESGCTYNKTLEGALVHFSCPASTTRRVCDQGTGACHNSVRIRAVTEMFQWVLRTHSYRVGAQMHFFR